VKSWWVWLVGWFVAWWLMYATVTSALNDALEAECQGANHTPWLEESWEL